LWHGGDTWSHLAVTGHAGERRGGEDGCEALRIGGRVARGACEHETSEQRLALAFDLMPSVLEARGRVGRLADERGERHVAAEEEPHDAVPQHLDLVLVGTQQTYRS